VHPRPLPRATVIVGRGRALLPRVVACVPGRVLCGRDLIQSSLFIREFYNCTIVLEYNPLLTGHVYSNLRFLVPSTCGLFNVVIPRDVVRRLLLNSFGESAVDVDLFIRFRHLVSSHV